MTGPGRQRANRSIGVAEEEGEEECERHEGDREDPPNRGARNERESKRTADERQSGGVEAQSAVRLGRGLAMAPQDVFHPILQLELAFLEGDFFDLFGF